MTVTFGKVWLDPEGTGGFPTWRIKARPHIMIRLKRLFDRAHKSGDEVWLKNTDEVCREIQWFMQRFPLEVSDEDSLRIDGGAAAFDRRAEVFEQVMSGELEPQKFDLALPLREYQRIAADLALRTRGLLIADDVGLGKTCMGIAVLTDPRTRPALIVTLTHLPLQWQRECMKFAPTLYTHIIKKGTPYALDRPAGKHDFMRPKRRFPDVLITNYHKLSGWADVLAGVIKTVVFDEVQELRRTGSDKAEAARFIAQKADFRVGMSVGPTSTIELVGGPFGNGWAGNIEDAYNVVASFCKPVETMEHEIVNVKNLGISSRGLVADGFGWKSVLSFVRHRCDKGLRTICVGGRNLVVTDDHAVYVARGKDVVSVRGDQLEVGDIALSDDGRGWKDAGRTETPINVIELMRHIPRAQVKVRLAEIGRKSLGLTAWQWQNCHKEASYGTRLPVDVFLRHQGILPDPDLVYVGRGKAPSSPPVLFLSEWAYVLGFFIGDGWVENRQRVSFAVDNEHVKKLVDALRKLPFKLQPKVQNTPSKRAVEIRCTHRIFAEIVASCGVARPCFEKFIPGEWLMTWTEESRRQLLEGLLDSDGSIQAGERNRKRNVYTTTSLRLADSVQRLVRSLGVTSSIHTRQPTRGGTIDGRTIKGRRPSYRVHWSAHALSGENAGHRGLRRKLNWSAGHFNEAPVRRIASAKPTTYVYDIEMDGHPSFVADGVLVHNSATPIYNYGGEFYNVVDVLRPDALGTREEFLREWCRGYGQREDKASIADPKAFGSYLREQCIMIRRTRKDVSRELPEVVRIPQYIECNTKALEDAQDAASELARIILAKDTGWEQRGKASREFDQRMRQATGIGKAPYVAEFIRMLVDNGERPVVFAWHRAVYDVLMERLKGLHPVLYTGSESPTQKEEARKAFIEGEAQVLIMSLRSGAGLDGLQHSSHTVVFAELDWSPGVHEQCLGRVHRDGQGESVICYFLLAEEGSDPVVSDVLGLKRQQIEGVRNPDAELVENLQADDDRIKRLAEAYLDRNRRTREVAGADGEAQPLPENVIPLHPVGNVAGTDVVEESVAAPALIVLPATEGDRKTETEEPQT